jgi:hypothetical protein
MPLPQTPQAKVGVLETERALNAQAFVKTFDVIGFAVFLHGYSAGLVGQSGG